MFTSDDVPGHDAQKTIDFLRPHTHKGTRTALSCTGKHRSYCILDLNQWRGKLVVKELWPMDSAFIEDGGLKDFDSQRYETLKTM